MASLTHDKSTGRYTVQTRVGRRAVRLGKLARADAEAARRHVDQIEAARENGQPIPRQAAAWLAGLSDRLHARAARAGLDAPRVCPDDARIDTFLAAYLKRRTDLKASTRSNLNQARLGLVRHFGKTRDLRTITRGEAGDWHRSLKEWGFSQATISMHVKKARQFFDDAAARGMIAANPFAALKGGRMTNPERFHYVTADAIAKVMAACPDDEWRLLFALARFGMLRVPSETLALTWADVDLAGRRILVRSCKTERQGKPTRVIPLFPELLAPLMAVRASAGDSPTGHVFRHRRAKNLHKNALRVIARAKVDAWPKLFQNLRASRETELADRFPIHVVCKWAGNTEVVARRHYLHAVDAHFAAAAGLPVPGVANSVASPGLVLPNETLTPMAYPPVFAVAGAAGGFATALGGGTAVTKIRRYCRVGRKAVRKAERRRRAMLRAVAERPAWDAFAARLAAGGGA
jgi:integrase